MADEVLEVEGEEVEPEPVNPYKDMPAAVLVRKYGARIRRLEAKGRDVRAELAVLALLEGGKGLAKAIKDELGTLPDLSGIDSILHHVDPKDETQDAEPPKAKKKGKKSGEARAYDKQGGRGTN